MSPNRITRVNELLRREIGEALFRITNESAFDVSAVMVSHVVASRDLRTARVLVSIRAPENERPAILAVLRRHRHEIQEQINRNIVLKYTPRLSFELDRSVERGDHVLSLLSQLEEESPGHGESDSPGEDVDSPDPDSTE